METILIVDDTKTNIKILLELLSDKYDVIVALTPQAALELAKKELPSLILLDIMMPAMDGFEVCQILKKNNDTKDIPIIFLTAMTDEDSIEKAYEFKGNDYVTKPFKPKELLARVKMQIDLKNMIDNLEYMCAYDSMTNIFNRRKFFELAINKFQEKKDDLYAVMIDIDKFKNINDSYGHHIGDIVIKKLAEIISKITQADYIFGRLGGEEFAIIGTFKDNDSAFQFIDNIRKKIKNTDIQVKNKNINFTISCGISKREKEHLDIDDLLKNADDMLYKAKESGRNKTIIKD